MSNTIKLNIIAPGRSPITEEIISLITENSSGQIEFMRGHAPIISSTIPTISRIKTADGAEKKILYSYLFYYCLSLSVHLEVMPCPVAAKSVC